MRRTRRFIRILALTLILNLGCATIRGGDGSGKPARILFLAGGREHDFRTHADTLMEYFQKTGKGTAEWEVRYTEDRDRLLPDSIGEYDLLIMYTQLRRLTFDQIEGLTDFVKAGGGLVGIHSTGRSFIPNERFHRMLGGTVYNTVPPGTFKVRINEREHPVASGIEDFEISDEFYLTQHNDTITILMTAKTETLDQDFPVAWVRDYGNGRVVYTILGHGRDAFENPNFLRLVTQGIQWALGDE